MPQIPSGYCREGLSGAQDAAHPFMSRPVPTEEEGQERHARLREAARAQLAFTVGY